MNSGRRYVLRLRIISCAVFASLNKPPPNYSNLPFLITVYEVHLYGHFTLL